MDTMCEMMALCCLAFAEMPSVQPVLVLFCPSQVFLCRKLMTYLSQVASGVIQHSTLLPIHFLPTCMLSQNYTTMFKAFARSSFFANHVLTWWFDEELWAGLLSRSGGYTLTQQAWRGSGSCGCLVARGITMTLCRERREKVRTRFCVL